MPNRGDINVRTSHAGWLAALTMALSQLIAIPAEAQSVASLQEVVVTARKRPELFRNLPMTAKRVHPADDQVGRTSRAPRDFIAMVPNMTLVQTQNVGNSFITIRGISQARNSEPSVAVIVDGVERPIRSEFAQELYRYPADRGAQGSAGRPLRP